MRLQVKDGRAINGVLMLRSIGFVIGTYQKMTLQPTSGPCSGRPCSVDGTLGHAAGCCKGSLSAASVRGVGAAAKGRACDATAR